MFHHTPGLCLVDGDKGFKCLEVKHVLLNPWSVNCFCSHCIYLIDLTVIDHTQDVDCGGFGDDNLIECREWVVGTQNRTAQEQAFWPMMSVMTMIPIYLTPSACTCSISLHFLSVLVPL